eukprot:7979566-Pyramimonas_sp.AAC.1
MASQYIPSAAQKLLSFGLSHERASLKPFDLEELPFAWMRWPSVRSRSDGVVVSGAPAGHSIAPEAL